MYFIIIWVDGDEDAFCKRIPLKLMGIHLKRLGFQEEIKVLVLYGYDLLSDLYIQELKKSGIDIIDVNKCFNNYSMQYSHLNRFGNYEKNCFLRWLVLKHYLDENDIREQLIHFDGDIMFNATPTEIKAEIRNKTFVLQGCPCMVSISNYDWFKIYKEQLNIFVKDIENYSLEAWELKPDYKTFVEKGAGEFERKILTSDQDLISYLISRDILPQTNPEEIISDNLYWVENPLYILSDYCWPLKQLGKKNGIVFSIRNNIGYIENKKIAFFHFQTDFRDYVARCFSWNPFARHVNHLEKHGIFSELMLRSGRHFNDCFRQAVYQKIREFIPTGQYSLKDIFSEKFWHHGWFREN